MSSAELLIKGFDALLYVTDPYSLFGFVFLIGMILIGLFVGHQKARAVLLVLFALLALGATYVLLESTLANVQEQLLVHLVRLKSRALVSPGVEIQLVDIETLKGKKSWEFNVHLDDAKHVFDEVFVRAGVDREGELALTEMDSDSWRDFLEGLENSDLVEEQLRAEKIKDIPFAKFRAFIDGVEDTGVSSKYYFKGETLCLPSDSSDCDRARLKIVNIYNTKHHTSGEPEAVNLQVAAKSQK